MKVGTFEILNHNNLPLNIKKNLAKERKENKILSENKLKELESNLNTIL